MAIDAARIITAEMKRARQSAEQTDRLAALRFQVETGGLRLPGAGLVRTTRDSQAQISGALESLRRGFISAPFPWKFDDGWSDVTAEQVEALAAAVARHVQACFVAERATARALESNPEADMQDTFTAAYAAAMEG
jgi:hypothetical protein